MNDEKPTSHSLARPPIPEPRFGEFVVIVALMMGVTAFAVDSILPAFPALGRDFAVADPNHLQLVVFVYMLGFGAAQLIYGPASDVVGRRPSYLVGAAIFVAGSILTLLAQDLTTLLVARFIQGLGAAAGRVLSVTIVRDRFSGREMARVMSLNMGIFITVPVLAPAIGSLIMLAGGRQALFASMLLVGVALAAWFWRRMPETLAEANRMPFSAARLLAGMSTVLSTRLTMGYATAGGLFFGCVMAMVGSSQQIFDMTFGLGAWFPFAFAIMAGSMGLASIVNSALVMRYGMRRLSHASILVLLALSFVQLAGALAFSGKPPVVLFCGIMAASQFLLGMAFPNFNAIAMEPLGKLAGTASSLLGVYTTLLGVLLGAVIGAAFDGTVIPIAIGYCAIAMVAVAVIFITERGRLFQPHHSP